MDLKPKEGKLYEKKSVAGLTFAIISAVVVLVALLFIMTVLDTNTIGRAQNGEIVVATSGLSVVMSVIGAIFSKSNNSLGVAGKIISIITLIAGTAITIIVGLMCWG
ncbi:MAG: hypothetical protein NC340_07790 [Ruminococcus flavefaciens]|nr:hypothetical protein [Ruminococcus flavefaciens]MCM1228686.1 hypothetical protein [Ruminococcus flavefaciens]